jgi:hypothetical protein
VPSNPSTVADDLREGWLTFDCEGNRRRLWPIPSNWESISDERLELACRAARPGRISDPQGVAVVSGEDAEP